MLNRCKNINATVELNNNDEETKVNYDDDFANRKFMEAFGAPMVRSEGGENDFFREIYLEVVQLKNKKYDLPFKGKASKRFISILTDEIEK